MNKKVNKDNPAFEQLKCGIIYLVCLYLKLIVLLMKYRHLPLPHSKG